MTTTQAPAEALAAATFDPLLTGVSNDVAAQLDADLDPSRVRSKQGKSYLAVHDVIRVANKIFGYGRWGYEVTDLTNLGSTTKTKDGKAGFYVGYRCTVRLTVAGCIPVSGVGYGDGIEYQEQAPVTAHELAVKEAESDALKRAFRNFGDQFGLILYAKDDEKRRIEADKQAEANKPEAATEESLQKMVDLAKKLGPDIAAKCADGIAQRRREGVVPQTWVENVIAAYEEKLAEREQAKEPTTDADIAAAFEQDTGKAA